MLDTAEMYGGGGAEEVIAHALRGRKERPYIVSKVYPHNASRQGVVEACENSLRRLQIERIDLYLLHWRGSFPYLETIEGFERLQAAGKIGAWGVSNLDADDMADIWDEAGGGGCQTDQVLYHLDMRWPEGRLLPALRERKTPLMAYSPLDQGRLGRNPALQRIASDAGVDPNVLALAWVMAQDDVFAVPKSAQPARIDGFLKAAEMTIPDDVMAALDQAFPAPEIDAPLEML